MPRTAATVRITTRPDPSQCRDDQLMTLGDAAALYRVNGHFSQRTLRTAVFGQSKPMNDAIAEQRASRAVPFLCSWSTAAGGKPESGGGR